MDDNEYELKVLEIAASKLINEIVIYNQIDLNNIEISREEIVYNIAQKIYSQSGKTFSFSRIRDLFDCRMKLAKEELEARQKSIESTFHRKTLEDDQHKELEKLEISQNSGRFGGDKEITKVFLRVRKIISEQLGVDEQEVNLDCHLSNHLGADDLELIELVMAIEEEFGIEISDEVSDSRLGISPNFSVSWGSGSSPSSSYTAGAECIVRNFVIFIHEKASS